MLNPDIDAVAEKFLRKRDKKQRRQIIERIEELCLDPAPRNSRRHDHGKWEGLMVNSCGEYRIIYDHDATTLHVCD